MAKDRTLDHPGFDGAGFEQHDEIPKGTLRFTWDDPDGQLDFDFNARRVTLRGDLDGAAKAFWHVIYKLSQAVRSPVVGLKYHGEPMVEADIRTGGIWHAFEDDNAKFLFNEFEIRAQSEY